LLVFFGLGQLALAEEKAETCEVFYEVFSLPLSEAAKLKRSKPGGMAMYANLVEGVEKKEVRQERLMVLRMIEGRNGVLEQVEEYIYPTEYDTENMRPMGMKMNLMESRFVTLPDIPMNILSGDFDTKNMGDTLEAEVQLAGRRVGLQMRAKHVGILSKDLFGKGVSEWVMPRFSVQALEISGDLLLGEPALVGTISPPKELQEKDGEKRVWLAFVTVEKI